MSQKLRAFLALLLCAAIYGSFGLFVKILSHVFTPAEQVFLRQIVSAIFALVILSITRPQMASLRSIPKKNFLFYIIAFPFASIFFTLSISHLKVSTATFIFYGVNLILSTSIGKLFFHEKIRTYTLIAFFLSMIGLMLYAYPFQWGSSLIGILYIIASGGMDAISTAFSKSVSKTMNKEIGTIMRAAFTVALMGSIMRVSGDSISLHDFTPLIIGIVLIFGLMLYVLNGINLYAFRYFDLHLGTFVLSSEVVFATIFGMVFLHEIPTSQEWMGAFFMTLGIVVSNYRVFKKLFLHTA